MSSDINCWEDLLRWKTEFPSVIDRWLEVLRLLVAHTYPKDDDLVGHLIVPFLGASLPDINDLMTLTCHDSHHGALKILRSLFERTITLKYIFENPSEAQRFMDFDAIDTEQILNGIKGLTGLGLNEPARTNLAIAARKAREAYRQDKCSGCGRPKYLGWTALNSKDMADRIDMGHLHLHAFLMPSKLIHPSYWGLRDVVSSSSPMINTLKCAHELVVQMLLVHRRHFAPEYFSEPRSCTPMIAGAIHDFLSVWVYSGTSFGGLLTRGETRTTGERIFY